MAPATILPSKRVKLSNKIIVYITIEVGVNADSSNKLWLLPTQMPCSFHISSLELPSHVGIHNHTREMLHPHLSGKADCNNSASNNVIILDTLRLEPSL